MRFDTSRAAQLIRAARLDAGLTQAELATRAGVQPTSLEQMESGDRDVSADLLEEILRAADYRPALPLSENAAAIRDAATRLGFARPRVFGSAARGSDHFTSDIDLMVTAGPGTDLFSLALLADEVERLTGFRADIVDDVRAAELMPEALAEAVPL
ncbi:MAG: helix-turn-helix domain-containing protein [Propionibacteriaceae bacterium]|nr:helix-turn-helix domain-containing protein [Propionibacteriaceae bacterium]